MHQEGQLMPLASGMIFSLKGSSESHRKSVSPAIAQLKASQDLTGKMLIAHYTHLYKILVTIATTFTRLGMSTRLIIQMNLGLSLMD